MKTINADLVVYYQSKSRNKNNPFTVTVLEIKGNTAKVRTHGETPIEFRCKISSLYNA